MHAFAETWRGRKRHSKSSEHPVLSANANPVNGGQPYLVAAEVRRLILDSGK